MYADSQLTTRNYTRNILDSNSPEESADLLTLVTYIKKQSNPKYKLKDTIVYLHKILNIEYTSNYKKPKQTQEDKIDPLDIFKKIRRRRKKCNVEELEIHGDEVLDEFIPLPHIDLIRERGIMPWTCEEFNIGYSPNKKRICLPERLWCGDKNSWLGVIGRTTVPCYEMLDIAKYLPIGKSFPKGMNLYGLNENYEHIQEAGYVTVVESQFSVLRRHSRNDKTAVSVGCHDITPEQLRILISLDVDVVICMDKDVSLEHIKQMCKMFLGIRNVYYMYDKWDLLGEKDSPCDLENKLYEFMFKYKEKYKGE